MEKAFCCCQCHRILYTVSLIRICTIHLTSVSYLNKRMERARATFLTFISDKSVTNEKKILCIHFETSCMRITVAANINSQHNWIFFTFFSPSIFHGCCCSRILSDLIRFQNFTPRRNDIIVLGCCFCCERIYCIIITFESNVLKLCVRYCNYSREKIVKFIINSRQAYGSAKKKHSRTQNTNNIFFKRFHLNRNQRRYT